MRIVLKNYTPHPVNVYDQKGNCIGTYPSEGEARVETENVAVEVIENGIPIVTIRDIAVKGLPDPQHNVDEDGELFTVLYIVSALVLRAVPTHIRGDLIAPDTTGDSVVTDEQGKICGVRRFIKM